MKTFWKIRILMSVWGFSCAWFFTGQIDLTSKIFIAQLIGNSFILWIFLKHDHHTN